MEHVFDVNPYVEQADRYGADKVKAVLDEGSNRVTLELVDVYGASISAPLLVDETFDNLEEAIEFYNDVIAQLYEGDVVRNLKRNGVLRESGSPDNRYPSF